MHAAQAELALGAGNGVNAAAQALVSAGGTGGVQVVVLSVLHVVAHAVHNVRGVAADVLHEGIAAQFAALHLLEAVFPVARQLRAAQGAQADLAEQVDEVHAAQGGDQVLAVAHDVFLGDEALDDGGAGGGGA